MPKRTAKPKTSKSNVKKKKASTHSSGSDIEADDDAYQPPEPKNSSGGANDDESSFGSSVASSTELLAPKLSESIEAFKNVDLTENKRLDVDNLGNEDHQDKNMTFDDVDGPETFDSQKPQSKDKYINIKYKIYKYKRLEITQHSGCIISNPIRSHNSELEPVSSQKKQSNGNHSKQNTFKSLICTILCCFIVLFSPIWFSIVFGNNDSASNETHVERNPRLDLYHEELDVIKGNFQSQNPRLWRTIKIALEENLASNENSHPAVLMLVSDKSAYATNECLAKKISNAFSSTCHQHVQVVDGTSLVDLSPEDAKYEMDKIITDGFTAGSCAVLISRFENIPAYATTAFYQFCENDNAPFKNVAIIFTVQVTPGSWGENYKDLSNLQVKLWDKILIEYLTHSLQSQDPVRMNDDMLGDLLSRITPSVAWVKTEYLSSLSC